MRRWAPRLAVALFPRDFSRDMYSAAAVARHVAACDVVLITYEELHSLRKGAAFEAFRKDISWWRVVSDESQACFVAASGAATATSWLWKSNVWCALLLKREAVDALHFVRACFPESVAMPHRLTTGTPLGSDLRSLHGLLEILDR